MTTANLHSQCPVVQYVGDRHFRVYVPTEEGSTCVLEFQRNPNRRTWVLEIADEVFRRHPEMIHAALGVGLMALAQDINQT